MTDGYLDVSVVPRELAGDDAAREARHQLLASLLGAFADGELPPETASQIDAHLLGCARCRREVSMHIALRTRLALAAFHEAVPAGLAALGERIKMRIAAMPMLNGARAAIAVSSAADSAIATTPASAHAWLWLSARGRLLIAALLAIGVLVAAPMFTRDALERRASPGPIVLADSVPLFAEVLRDYRQVMMGDLPGRARDLDAVRAAVPFPVEPAHSASLRLLAAWTTDLEGQPSAVLAYRWNDRIVLQYVIADDLLFRYPSIRAALANGQQASAYSAQQGMLAWAMPAAGTLVVGDMSPEQLRVLWGVADGR